MNMLRQLYEKHRQIILYLFFGGLTTVVNWGVHFPLYNFAGMQVWLCTVIAWAASVLFAFFTNKPFVFKSSDWSAHVMIPEFLKFVGCRVGSGLMELGLMVLTVEFLHWNGNIMKIAVSVLVVVANYIGSKLLFKNK